MNNYMVHYNKGSHGRICFAVDCEKTDLFWLAEHKNWDRMNYEQIDYDPCVKFSLAFYDFVKSLPIGACFKVNRMVGINYGGTDDWDLVPYKWREVPNDPKEQDKFIVMSDLRVYNPRHNQVNTVEKVFHLHYK